LHLAERLGLLCGGLGWGMVQRGIQEALTTPQLGSGQAPRRQRWVAHSPALSRGFWSTALTEVRAQTSPGISQRNCQRHEHHLASVASSLPSLCLCLRGRPVWLVPFGFCLGLVKEGGRQEIRGGEGNEVRAVPRVPHPLGYHRLDRSLC